MSQVKLKFFVKANPQTQQQPQKCDLYGCTSHGAYRAPKSHDNLRDYYWFCLPHIRDYNARWDYFKDLDAEGINAQVAYDDIWNRDTKPFGHRRRDYQKGHQGPTHLPPKVEQALLVLGLSFPFTLDHLKAQYKNLVKENHPDLYAQDFEKLEKLKAINLAYDVLQTYLSDHSH